MKPIMHLAAISLGLFGGVSLARAAAPAIFFSDMTDGPTTGFNGSAAQGAAISVWGHNLGASRGSSTLTVGGVTLSSDGDFAEWGATANPTVARGLQRITFYLNSSMLTSGAAPNTTIKVTVGGVSSSTIPFHCRALGANHIYFVSPSGNDAANGTSTATPWRTGKKLRTTLVAGDIAYLRGGTYTDVDDNYSTVRGGWISIWSQSINSGTAYNSIGVIAYPGELAQIGNGDLNYTGNPLPDKMVERFGSAGSVWNFWTFSKIKAVLAEGVGIDTTGSVTPNGDDNIRYVGMDIRTTSTASGTGIAFTKEGGSQGSTHFYLLGNYFHQTGVPLPPANPPTLSAGTGSGLTGAYNAKYTYLSYRSPGLVGQESEMSAEGTPVSLTDGALHITWSQPSTNRQLGDPARAFTHVRLYRTQAGGSTYYFDQEAPIGSGFVDSTTADGALSARSTIEGGYYVGAMYFGGYGHLDYIYVLYNEMDSLNGAAIQNYGHVVGDYMDHLHFAYNFVRNSGTCAWNHRPAAILGGGDGGSSYQYSRSIYVYNNLYVNNLGSAIRVDSQSWGGGGNYYIMNNTIYNDAASSALQGYALQIGGGPLTTVQFQNNIVFTPGGIQYNAPYTGTPLNSVQGLSEDHNLFYGLGANRGLSVGAEPYPWAGTAAGNIYDTDPQFSVASPSSFLEFKLKSISPVVNVGADLGAVVAADLVGVGRPQGVGFDFGAFEYSADTVDTASPSAPKGLRIK